MGEWRVPSEGAWFRWLTMDFSLDVASFFGGLGCIDEGEVTTEAILKLSKAGLRSDEGCSCGRPALMS